MKNAGFTYFEMMLVITLLGILMSLDTFTISNNYRYRPTYLPFLKQVFYELKISREGFIMPYFAPRRMVSYNYQKKAVKIDDYSSKAAYLIPLPEDLSANGYWSYNSINFEWAANKNAVTFNDRKRRISYTYIQAASTRRLRLEVERW